MSKSGFFEHSEPFSGKERDKNRLLTNLIHSCFIKSLRPPEEPAQLQNQKVFLQSAEKARSAGRGWEDPGRNLGMAGFIETAARPETRGIGSNPLKKQDFSARPAGMHESRAFIRVHPELHEG